MKESEETFATQVELYAHGGPDSLRLVHKPVPAPGAGQLLVRVRAAGVAFADVMMRHGKYPGAPPLPFVPGYDIMGEVEAVGEGVQGFHVGDALIAITKFGGYTEAICIEARRALKVDADVDPAEAVTLVLNYVSAYQMLHHIAKVQAGQSILVHSAAGGVGTALLQLARTFGVTTYGTCSAPKAEVVKMYGGVPIDYRKVDFVEEMKKLVPLGVDAVFDPIGGDHWKRSRAVLRRGGHLVGFGTLASFEDDQPRGSMLGVLWRAMTLKLVGRGRRFSFFGVSFEKDPDGFLADLSVVYKLYRAGKIEPHIDGTLPLSEAAEAHRRLSAGEARGKIVLSCS